MSNNRYIRSYKGRKYDIRRLPRWLGFDPLTGRLSKNTKSYMEFWDKKCEKERRKKALEDLERWEKIEKPEFVKRMKIIKQYNKKNKTL